MNHDLIIIYFVPVRISLPMRTEFSGVEAAARVEAPQARAQEQADGEEHERRSKEEREPVDHVLLYVARTLEGWEREDPLSADGSDGHDTISDFGLLIGEEAQDSIERIHRGFQSRWNHSEGEQKYLEEECKLFETECDIAILWPEIWHKTPPETLWPEMRALLLLYFVFVLFFPSSPL